MRKLLTGLAVAVAVAAAMAGSTPAGAVVIDLTVESSTATAPLFAGRVDTQPHPVDGGDGSGAHACAGPPGGPPSPTATGALDDALRGAGVPWRGNWDPSFRDFFIDRIGPFASAPPDDYWSLTVNGRFSAGGCLTMVSDGDEVDFSYGPLFGPGPTGGGGGGSPPNATQTGTGGSGTAGDHRTGPRMRRLAARASAYLRKETGVGEEWARLALALRGGRDLAGSALRLGERLRTLSGGESSGQDVDSAALAAWVLELRGQHVRARRLAALVRSAQAADGGFPTMPGGASNAQSTGVALVALRVTGLGPQPTADPDGPTPLDYLASLARRDGSIAYRQGDAPTPVWTTAQALLGLTTKAKLMQLDTLRANDD